MSIAREALLYDKLEGGAVRCRLCAHGCTIAPGARGLCAVRENQAGRLTSLVFGRLVARDADPVEKKPLYHVYPGTKAFSIATVGCNFTCLNCQNHFLSQYPRQHEGRILGDTVEPDVVVEEAAAAGCRSIAYTYGEPTVALEYYLEIMERARAAGLANLWVTNGYFSHEAARAILPRVDAMNIDLKGITDAFYRHVAGANVRPVLDSIERAAAAGVWVEVTTLVIPGLNDAPDDLRWTAEAVAGISPAIPWHVSRFFPAFRLADRPPTPVATLERARDIGRNAGLKFVYIGNVPGEGETTVCPACGRRLIRRVGYVVRENALRDGSCPACGRTLEGRWEKDGPVSPTA
ncbi:MAG: AmmeMemoRadiSam system radical SAM enzyme [Candidatus Bipolaricaulota bacterium]